LCAQDDRQISGRKAAGRIVSKLQDENIHYFLTRHHEVRLKEAAMIFRIKISLLALLAIALCATASRAQVASGPTATASPTSAAFGVPTGSTVSAPQTVTVAATGGTVTVGTVTITGSGDFTIQTGTDGCSGQALAAPSSTCTINVIFTPTASGLETATLNIPTSASALSVPLSGAKGAIKLFDEINVNSSNPNGTFANPYVFKSAPLTLSCPAGAAPANAKLSSTPDGVGNVLVDNYITLSVNNTLVTIPTGTGPAGNVCKGGPSDSFDGLQYPDCFSSTYENAAASSIGTNPDTMIATWGVPAIDVSADLVVGSQSATFSLLDAGGEVASSTVFLVTSCSSPGVQTGGTLTANPLDPNNPGSLTPQFLFNTTPGNHITFAADFLNANNFDGTTTPSVADTGIPQSAFAAYVTGTSAAPAMCVRLSGEVDGNGNALCKAFTITCTDSSGNSAGTNCPQQTAARTLLFESRLDSPDAIPNPFPAGTGPGLLMGSDSWTSAATCVFPSGALSGQLCPQDPLTEFKGAADPTGGATPRSVNSTFIPVYNMPLPQTTVTIPAATASGWVNTRTVVVNFASNPASYPGSINGFVPANIASFTYGQGTPVPDPTFPVPGDITTLNGTCPTAAPAPFHNTATFTYTADGQYNNVHYFATDCANTEELNFVANASPSVNWAQFKTVLIKIDTVAPTIGAITFNPTSAGNIFAVGQAVMANFSCTDNPSGSGIDPTTCFGTAAMATGAPTTGIASGHNIPTSQAGTYTFTVTAKDNAGNPATPQVVTYQVVGSSDLALLNLASLTVKTGTKLTYGIAVLNLGPTVADNVVVTDTIPAGTTLYSAGYATVTCTFAGCSDAPGLQSCNTVGGVTCNIPTVGLLKNFTGVLVKVVVTVNAPANTILKDTATVTEANQDPHTGNNSGTAITKVTK
jgi:uncharacterized repeat protein (TIGR01451 family)